MNYSQKITLTVYILLILSSFVFWQAVYVSAQSDQAGLKLQEANDAVNSAFSKISDAERAGVNVTNLLTQLNLIAESLASAESAYRQGDYIDSIAKCNQVIQATPNLISAAQNERQIAAAVSAGSFWVTIPLSIVGIIVYVVFLNFFWCYFKRRYLKEILQSKPEVLAE